MMTALIIYDIKIVRHNPGPWLLSLVFFILFLTLCAIALHGQADMLQRLAPALIWLALLLSVQLSLPQIFQFDYLSDSLAHMFVANITAFEICLAKMISFLLIYLLPLWATSLIAVFGFNLPIDDIIRLGSATACALPALAAYSILAASLTVTPGSSSSLLVIFITTPLFIPLLIFGINAPLPESHTIAIRALVGLSLLNTAIGLPAAAFALKTAYE